MDIRSVLQTVFAGMGAVGTLVLVGYEIYNCIKGRRYRIFGRFRRGPNAPAAPIDIENLAVDDVPATRSQLQSAASIYRMADLTHHEPEPNQIQARLADGPVIEGNADYEPQTRSGDNDRGDCGRGGGRDGSDRGGRHNNNNNTGSRKGDGGGGGGGAGMSPPNADRGGNGAGESQAHRSGNAAAEAIRSASLRLREALVELDRRGYIQLYPQTTNNGYRSDSHSLSKPRQVDRHNVEHHRIGNQHYHRHGYQYNHRHG